jgi:hypothetical protein
LSVERNGKKKGESPGRVDLGKRKTKRHAATKAAKKVQKAYLCQRCITAGLQIWIQIRMDPHYFGMLDPDPH